MDILSREDAIAKALQQHAVQEQIGSRSIKDVIYTSYEGLEGVVNVLTERHVPVIEEVAI